MSKSFGFTFYFAFSACLIMVEIQELHSMTTPNRQASAQWTVKLILAEIVLWLKCVGHVLYWCLVGSIRALLPAKYLPQKSVRDEVVLVTGAGSGIGRLLAVRFARLGARLVLWDVDGTGMEETMDLLAKRVRGREHKSYVVDLSVREEVYSAAQLVSSEVGDVDVLVNNAGVVTGRRFLECPDDLMLKTIHVNTLAHVWTCKAFLPSMQRRNHGHVVSISSSAGLFGTPSQEVSVTRMCLCKRLNSVAELADYCASKFAVVGLTESLFAEYQTRQMDGLNFTLVCPFFINTGLFDGVTTVYPSILPILEADYAADKIMEAILTNQMYLMMPRFVYWVYFLKGFLPVEAAIYLGHFFGATRSMESFKGRQA